MIKKKYHKKLFKGDMVEDHKWFFCAINTKRKRIKPKEQTKSSKKWSVIFFLLNIGIVIGILSFQLNSKAGIEPLSELFSKEHNIKFLILAVLCFLLYEFITSLKLSILTHKFSKKFKFSACLKSEFVFQYYSKIIPLGVAGHPFEVYELNRHGVKANNAIATVSCNYVSNKLTYWLIGILMMVLFFTNDLAKQMGGAKFNIVITLAIIALSIITIYVVFVILIMVNKKIANTLVKFLVTILYKLKIVKNRFQFYLKIMRPALSFQYKMKNFFKSKKLAMTSLLLSIVSYLVQSSIIACIYFIFVPFNIPDYISLVALAVIIQLASSIMPLPGGSGVAELSFYSVFSILIDNSMLFWALLLWRFLTFYIYLFIGLGITIYSYIKYGKKKNLSK